jgi:hypothetical protein
MKSVPATGATGIMGWSIAIGMIAGPLDHLPSSALVDLPLVAVSAITLCWDRLRYEHFTQTP